MIRPAILVAVALGATGVSARAQSGVVNVGDALIHYERSGQGEALVFIHGWAQDLTIWDDQVPVFSPRYQVLRYDRRGFGASTGHADPTADADDLRILLDSLGIASAHVLGLSAGAGAALHFGIMFPERVTSLVLYGIGPPPGFPVAPPPELFAAFASWGEIARQHGLDSLRTVIFSSPLVAGPRSEGLSRRLDRLWARYEGRDLLDPRPPSGRLPPPRMDQVDALRVPTLLVHGDHEMPFLQLVADTLTHRIPGARKVVVPGGGHGVHFAEPERFNRVILEFLETVTARR